MVGIDPVAGAPRFTFGMDRLLDGVSFVAVIVGVFGLSEILSHRKGAETPLVHAPGIPLTAPTRTEWRRSAPAMARGTGVGFGLGLDSRHDRISSSLLSYAAEKKFSRFRHQLGKGAVEGVAGPGNGNNATPMPP